MDEDRRLPNVKEKFLEGNRQKFTVIFILYSLVLLGSVVIWKIDPAPFLTFMTFVGSFYLGGATLTAWVTANKTDRVYTETKVETKQVTTANINDNTSSTVNTNTNTQTTNSDNQNIKIDIDEKVKLDYPEYHIDENDPTAPKVKPYAVEATQE